MIVKQVLKEETLTLPEVKNILDNIREERETEGKELGYELRKAISHSESFSKISAKLVEELLKLEKMKPEIAIRIADILPLSNDEIRTIYAKERYTLSEDELKQILDLVIKFE
jgi:DNA-directed RNA polymerase subunit F